MKNYFVIALKSLLNRSFVVSLTMSCIALSTALLLTLEKIKNTAEGAFTQTVSQVDLLVGARSGQLQLLLYSVFNMGQATNNVSWKSYQYWKSNPAVEWTIPYSLGDSYRGFRTVATDGNFFEHYRFKGDRRIEFAEGQPFAGDTDVVIGSQVAKELKLRLGDAAVITHGVTKGAGFDQHDQHPFRVSGILKKTGTAIDQAVYFSLQAMELMHMEKTPQGSIEIQDITSFFLRTKNRIEVLKLQRDINEYEKEPLMAVIPGMVLSELWRNLSYFEVLLKWISWIVAGFSLLTLLLMMLSSLETRRREMTLFRALGAHLSQISLFLVIEAFVVSLMGVVLGWLISRLGFILLGPLMSDIVGVDSISWGLLSYEYLLISIILVGSVIVSLIPALKVSRQVLKDGLTIKI
jgi:putative ABC transport system permease protein